MGICAGTDAISRMDDSLQKCSVFSKQQCCCLIRLTVHSELGCGLEEGATVAKLQACSRPCCAWHCANMGLELKGIVVPLKNIQLLIRFNI